MTENTIVYNGILTPQVYLKIMTGKYFTLAVWRGYVLEFCA